MGKTLSKEEIIQKIKDEKIFLYERELHYIKQMFQEYLKDKKKLPVFNNFRDQVSYVLTQKNKFSFRRH